MKTCSTARTSTASATAPTAIQDNIQRLKVLTAEGKPVFVVEYPRDEEQARTAQREIAEQNFIGLVARRTLDHP